MGRMTLGVVVKTSAFTLNEMGATGELSRGRKWLPEVKPGLRCLLIWEHPGRGGAGGAEISGEPATRAEGDESGRGGRG